jgi:Fic family protein
MTRGKLDMSHRVSRRWEGNPGAPGGRRARRSFSYEAFVPDRIADLSPSLRLDAAERVFEATRSMELAATASPEGTLETVGSLLLHAEARASSLIEGITISQRNLARALLDPRIARGDPGPVIADVRATEESIRLATQAEQLRIDHVLDLHRTLMAQVDHARPGGFRTTQNWIGRSSASPEGADYIPPPETEVVPLMEDLVDFVGRDDLPAVAQAAIAHAQFETIHPFIDGNGRVGRCLVQLILRRRGVATFTPPVSLILASMGQAYIDGLVAYREDGLSDWCDLFAEACSRAGTASSDLAGRVLALQADWLDAAGRPRRGSAAARVIALLARYPVLDAALVRDTLGVDVRRAIEALELLTAAGVLHRLGSQARNRRYEAIDLFELVSTFEQDVASGHIS